MGFLDHGLNVCADAKRRLDGRGKRIVVDCYSETVYLQKTHIDDTVYAYVPETEAHARVWFMNRKHNYQEGYSGFDENNDWY